MLYYNTVPFDLAYEDDPPKDPPAGDPPKDPPAGDPPKDPPDTKEKKFSQDDVNRIMKEDKLKLRNENQELIKQLEVHKNASNMTKKQREELQTRIQELEERSFSKEELAAKEKAKLEKEKDEVIKTLTGERDDWKERFTGEVINTTILQASVKAKAVQPDQMLAMLRPNTSLTAVKDDDGEFTGAFVPMVKFRGEDKDGKPTDLQLTVDEAMKQMQESPDLFGNLFMSGKKGGIGGANDGGRTGPIDLSKLSLPEYQKLKAEGKIPGM